MRIIGAAMLIVASGFAADAAQAQQPGSKRTDLQRYDLSIPGREVVQVRVDFDPGYVAPRHTHFGEEIIYILEGTLVYEVEGRPPTTYKAGDVLVVPAGAIHSVTNVGTSIGAELATYVVEKGKPLITFVK
ncbi:MAG: cupin domain-containing protein, partial [Gemmatimonadaceae bacterium]